MAVAEFAKALRQELRSEAVRRADADRAVGLQLCIADRLRCRRRELVHLFGHFEQPVAGLCEG
ncbi:Uncharacterised protein [Mycobacterium tuberculosis]|nr:Uncharacterised protein [Mycobacterium tuberculosis]